jgi:ribosomal-protein-alanine N-acetyltransferase
LPADTPPPIEVQTDRLLLRPIPPDAAARLPGDRRAASELIGAAFEEAWPLPDILELMPLFATRSAAEAPFGAWVMIEAESNLVVGEIGFIRPPDDAGEIEVGYSVVPSRRRRGYATEALAALVRWAFEQPAVMAIVAGTDPDNDPSQRVLRSAGFEVTDATPAEIRWRREPALEAP